MRQDYLELYALLDRIIERINKLESRIEQESTFNSSKIKDLNKKLDSSYTPFVPTPTPLTEIETDDVLPSTNE